MKKVSLYTIILVTSLLSCKAQKTEVREVPAFDKIKLTGALSVLYTGSDTNQVSVSARESDLEKVTSQVENSTLILSTKGNLKGPVTVTVKNSKLLSLQTSGATSFKTTSQIKSDSIDLNLSGASDVKLMIETNKINCTADGAANLTLEGSSNDLKAELSGAANLKAYKLVAKTASVEASGAASAKINVTEKVHTTASGASDVKIKGEPKELSAEASSAASISRSKETAKNTDKESCDTTYYNWKNKRILVYSCPKDNDYTRSKNNKHGFRHWTGFSMASNGYFNGNGGTTMPDNLNYMELDYGKSFNYQFNLFENQINLAGNRLKIISGFGFDYHSYALANKTTLEPDGSYTSGTIDSTEKFSYKKNKFRNTYIQVPLLLEYNTSNNPAKTFHIAAGVVGEFLIASRTKQVLGFDNNELTNVRKDSYNLSPFACKAHVNLGYANWTFFAEYNLTPLFQSGEGPVLYPFTAGLRIIPFNSI